MLNHLTLTTPYLLLDKVKFERNINRLYQRIEGQHCQIRPHLKTLRTLQAAPCLLQDLSSPATVSTLAEAEAFTAAGYSNVLYAVGIAPGKLPRVAALRRNGKQVHVLLDSMAQAQAVSDYGLQHQVIFSVFIEIDCDGHRGGIQPADAALTAIARHLHQAGMVVEGVMTHAGESYHCRSQEEIILAAQEECQAAVTAANHIRAAGIPCPVVSVGSTPTAHAAHDLQGVTEVRAGVFSTFDLFMHNLGVCTRDDIALSVVTTVIGHNHEKGWIFVDAGWMAMSRDRGTAAQHTDYGYGLVCDDKGCPLGLLLTTTNQEHGIITLPHSGDYSTTDFPLGTVLRVLPNHACATAAMHTHYQVIDTRNGEHEVWQRVVGW
ncbi:D-serine deaminase-like pyridoxal phosphate-dependent protein [Pantoea allii]|uniref:D-serine deaminase-like pyridoxal phosphate-dependent protein n=1 Tax=Pantoea allii TaxID=574096 RepID=A0A2V2BNL7_9GAMM|nr:DSD1 family PLP-dependent enzyme [Pantoea allii]PWL00788.1 D-serine deaminase-like pyridoxal phosphate-dependent protein [Pantoea allii]